MQAFPIHVCDNRTELHGRNIFYHSIEGLMLVCQLYTNGFLQIVFLFIISPVVIGGFQEISSTRNLTMFPDSLNPIHSGSGLNVPNKPLFWVLLTNCLASGLIINGLMSLILQSPPKESIHFCRAKYSKLRGARWKVGGAPTQGWVWCTPYFSSSPPRFWVLGFATSVYFLSVETVHLSYVHEHEEPCRRKTPAGQNKQR